MGLSSQMDQGAKILAWPKRTELRYTYRYEKNKRAYERHYSSLDEAVARAVDDISTERGVPICIKCEGRMLMEPDELYDAWSAKHLEDPVDVKITKKPTY
jgi:hypothetical protein